MKNWQLGLIVVLAIAGFICTFSAGVSWDRLSAEGADAGPWDYGYCVFLPLLGTVVCVLGRVAFRFFAVRPAGDASTTAKPMPKWIGNAAKDYAERGDSVGLNKLVASVIEYEKTKG